MTIYPAENGTEYPNPSGISNIQAREASRSGSQKRQPFDMEPFRGNKIPLRQGKLTYQEEAEQLPQRRVPA